MERDGRHEPAHRAVARELGVAIVTGRRWPGEIFPREIELAEQFGLSRSVIREALRMLAAKGLIESRPKAGTRVRARSAWSLLDPDLLQWMFEGAPPPGFVRSLFQLRLIIEPAAAEIAAAERTADQVAQLQAAFDAMERHGLGTGEGQRADESFHRCLLEATGNELLASLAAGITAAVRWTTIFKYRSSRQPRDPIPQHRVVMDAIVARDCAAARAAMATLVRQAQRDTETALGG